MGWLEAARECCGESLALEAARPVTTTSIGPQWTIRRTSDVATTA
jgi:hypothetical protein